MTQPTSATFRDVTTFVTEQLQRNGVDVDPTKAVLAMTSRVGQLAAFCGDKFAGSSNTGGASSNMTAVGSSSSSAATTSASMLANLNQLEQRELKNILGDLTVALFAVGASTGVDLAEAALQGLGMPAGSSRTMQTAFPSSSQQQQQQQQQQLPMMAAAAAQSQSQSSNASPLANQPGPGFGHHHHGGHHHPHHQHGGGGATTSMPPVASQGSSISQPASLRPVQVQSVSVPPTNYSSAPNSQQSSQSPHWRPHQSQPQHQQYSPPSSGAAADTSLNPNSISNVKAFIQAIRGQTRPLTDAEFADVGLTFSYDLPHGETVPLIPNGRAVAVRANNFEEFCHLFFERIARAPSSDEMNGSQPRAGGSGGGRPTMMQMSELNFVPADNDNNPGLNSPTLRPVTIGGESSGVSTSSGGTQRPMTTSQQGGGGGGKGGGSGGDVVSREDGVIVRRIAVDKTGHQNLEQEQACYSPSHFNQGLFSPQAKGDTIDVTYAEDGTPNMDSAFANRRPSQEEEMAMAMGPAGGGAPRNNNQQLHQQQNGAGVVVPFPQLQQGGGGGGDGGSPQRLNAQNQQQSTPHQQVQQTGLSSANNNQQRTSGASSPSTVAGAVFPNVDPKEIAATEALFNPRFTHLERIVVDVEDQLVGRGNTAASIRQVLPQFLPREEIASLNLTFSIPFRGSEFELTEGGSFINVTPQNAKDFVTLVRDQRAIFEGRLNKKASVKTLAVAAPHGGDPAREHGSFNYGREGHTGEKSLTAPPESKSTFTIDTDDSANLVPKVLQHIKLPAVIPTSSHYVAFISSRPEHFPEMFKVMRQKPEMLGRWNVSYVVPDPEAQAPHALQHATEHNPRRCGVRELIPGGMSTTVRETDLETFVNMVLQVAPQLPGCLQPV